VTIAGKRTDTRNTVRMGHDGAGHDNAMRQRAVLHGGKLNAGGLDLICRQLNVHLLIVDAFGPGFASRPGRPPEVRLRASAPRR
jgi:hypothetical protein